MKNAGFFKIIAACLILTAGAGAAQAQDPLCDTALFTQMSQRARLLGQFETSVMQNLVYKPDSVLEYTCFNNFMDVSVSNMTYYMTPFYITNVIQAGVTNYINANFGHNFMGDRMAASTPPTGAYVCDVMTTVWEGAKCNNFSHVEPQDNLYGLEEFVAASDIRVHLGSCSGPSAASYGDIPVMGATIATAFPATATDCGQPIPTGLVIDQPVGTGETRPQTYNEKICPNASCNYTPTGMNSGTCDP